MATGAQDLVLRCSAAPRWVPCPGSVLMEAQYPETEESEHAREGTAVHWAATQILGNLDDRGTTNLHNSVAPNGVVITQDMLDAVGVYIRDVVAVMAGGPYSSALHVERPVYPYLIHPNNRGTLDGSCYGFPVHGNNPGDERLIIWDLKYGWGLVEVRENWQLLNYAAGVIWEIHDRGGSLPHEVELRICQPRPYHPDGLIRSWRITTGDLLEHYVPRMRKSAESATSGTALCATGPHCNYCRARHVCPAIQQGTYKYRDLVEQALPHELSGAALGRELTLLAEMRRLVDARKSGLEAQALAEIKQGRDVPGWTAGSRPGNRAWDLPVEEVLQLGQLMGVNVAKPGVLSPAQAEKAGLNGDIIARYTQRAPGALKLTPQDNNRAKEVFDR